MGGRRPYAALPPGFQADPGTQAWDRQRADTEASFEAFRAFRDSGAGNRNMTRVAQSLGKPPSQLSLWSRKHFWRERCLLYDREQDRLWQEQINSTRWVVAQRQVAIARQFQQKVVDALPSLDPRNLSPSELVAMLNLAVRIESEHFWPHTDRDGVVINNQAQIIIDPRLVAPATIDPADVVDDETYRPRLEG